MELRVLKYFLTVADEGNITRAADILHVTQPTLSRQLMELEDEMGTALLIRGKRSVTLTDEGFLFKQQAETIVELADKLEHTFTDQKDVICGTIRIGATEALGGRTLAAHMKEFREKYPDVQFDLYNGMADNIKEMIEHGLIDLGLVMEPIDTSKFEYVRYGKKLIQVNPSYTSQICANCGKNNHRLGLNKSEWLAVREWDCPNCGKHLDRDINAAQVILQKGLAIR